MAKRYLVGHRYTANRDGLTYGPWPRGTEVELDEEVAEWVKRDSPGALTDVLPDPEPALAVVTPVIEIPTVEVVEVTADAEPESEAEPEPVVVAEPEVDEAGDEKADEDETEETERQAKPARNRQHRSTRNRSA